MARWCDGGCTQHSRLGTLTDKAVETAKRRAAEATLGKVQIEKNVLLDNVYSFEYLGGRLQCDGDDEDDVRYRMDIAQAAFASLPHLWMDHRLSCNMKLRLYNLCICSTEYRNTAISPAYNLLLAVRQRRLRYLGHLLRLPRDSVVRQTLIAMTDGDNPNRYPEGSIFMDCQGSELKDIETLPVNRTVCMSAQSGDTCVLMLYCIIGPTGSIMNIMVIEGG